MPVYWKHSSGLLRSITWTYLDSEMNLFTNNYYASLFWFILILVYGWFWEISSDIKLLQLVYNSNKKYIKIYSEKWDKMWCGISYVFLYGFVPGFSYSIMGIFFQSNSVILSIVFFSINFKNVLLAFPKEKESNVLFCKLCSFVFIVWHRRLKNQKTPKEGLTGLINEDKELADLRGLAPGVGLANACYVIQYVTWAGITGHLDEEWATLKRVSTHATLPRTVLLYAHIILAYSKVTPPFTLKCDLGWMANYVVIIS